MQLVVANSFTSTFDTPHVLLVLAGTSGIKKLNAEVAENKKPEKKTLRDSALYFSALKKEVRFGFLVSAD